MQIIPLAGNHNRQGFDCGRAELNLWLQQVARQHQQKGLSKTFVTILPTEPEAILGYYALSLAELENQTIPLAWQSKLSRRIPGIRLGRLAIDKTYQGKGLGELLLLNAIDKARKIHTEAGGIGLFVDAIDENAVAFYQRYGFLSVPDNPLLLFYPIQTIRLNP